MKLIPQALEMTSIDRLYLHPRNPRRGSITSIRHSIEANGWYGAVVAQRSSGYILAGNHRYQAALEQGARDLPVLWLDVDDEESQRILLADNRTSDEATYDNDQLARLLEELSETPRLLEGTGFDEKDLAELLGETVSDADTLSADDQSEEIDSRYEIIVCCPSEEAQAQLLTRLSEEGYSCRALIS